MKSITEYIDLKDRNKTVGSLLIYISYLFLFPIMLTGQETNEDTIPVRLGEDVEKSIYTSTPKKHGGFYYWAWGRHYSDLYYQPVTVKTASLERLAGGLSITGQLPKLHALILHDKHKQPYLLKPLGGSSSFLESKFFQDVYQQKDFKNTYLNDFITEAYTIVHPYIFIAAEYLAKEVQLSNATPRIIYLAQGTESDTISDGSHLKNKLATISRLPIIETEGILNSIDTLLDKLHQDNFAKVDQAVYIKSRLFDMLIGDWNKISENWYWIPTVDGDSTIYIPQSLDRSHAFAKVDGAFFKELLNILGVGFITNYEENLKNVRKFNKLAYPLDIAITQSCTAIEWQAQAKELKQLLTDDVIDNAFSRLPKEMQNEEVNLIRKNLKQRKKNLENIALEYYKYTQKTPVVTGSDKSERFVIDQDKGHNLRIRIYDKQTNVLTFDKLYTKKYTKEIWLYGLGGNDDFEIDKKKRNISLLLIGGEGRNNYNIIQGKNVSIYEYKSEKERLREEIKTAKVIIPNDESALDYDYQQLKYSTVSFTPIGLYDSDLGLNIGTSVAYTLYGFRRAPYTRRHQISYDYTNGFTYQGIFPSYDHKKSLHVAAYFGSPAYFSNFFGFGNSTSGYKDQNKRYNRVNITKYMLAPALYYNITKEQTLSATASFEVYKVKNPSGRNRLVNTVYEDSHHIYDPNYFMNLSLTYELDKKLPYFLSSISLALTGGWNLNITGPERNYAYAKAKLGLNFKITDRITFATQLKGTALSSSKYEFYQAATTELRGFRDNRFIGQHSFYQYSDIRLDMGKLENPFTPLKYGVFAGVDHGRVWYKGEISDKWYSSYGGGFWLTILRKFTGKFSYFGSSDGSRFMFQLGMGF